MCIVYDVKYILFPQITRLSKTVIIVGILNNSFTKLLDVPETPYIPSVTAVHADIDTSI